MKSEFDLYPIWQSFCRGRRKTSCGRLQGLYSGEQNSAEGPDFKNARFILDDFRYCGDVEIHLRSKDWFTHGHHFDSRYDRVMLHLVWDAPAGGITDVKTSDGRSIPGLSMRTFPPLLVPSDRVARCQQPAISRESFSQNINKVVRQRLTGLGRQLFQLAAVKNADQVFYEGLLRIIGSPQNTQNYLWMAQKLTWEQIIHLKHKVYLSVIEWYALLLNLAGLAPTHENFLKLRSVVYRVAPLLPAAKLCRPMWKLAGQRPQHHPLRRLAGLALFIHSFPHHGFYCAMRDLFYSRYPYSMLNAQLRRIFQLSPPPSIQSLFGEHPIKKLWGDDLLSEIIGNIVIPFFYFQAQKSGSQGFTEYLEMLYFSLPFFNQYAGLRNFDQWPEIRAMPVNRFYLPQALLHIRNNYCLNDLCRSCPLGRIPEIR